MGLLPGHLVCHCPLWLGRELGLGLTLAGGLSELSGLSAFCIVLGTRVSLFPGGLPPDHYLRTVSLQNPPVAACRCTEGSTWKNFPNFSQEGKVRARRSVIQTIAMVVVKVARKW